MLKAITIWKHFTATSLGITTTTSSTCILTNEAHQSFVRFLLIRQAHTLETCLSFYLTTIQNHHFPHKQYENFANGVGI